MTEYVGGGASKVAQELSAYFKVFAIGGIFLIFILGYESEHLPEGYAGAIRVLVATLVIAIYWRYVKAGLRDDKIIAGNLRFDDSLYFLGFLFTLSALGSALMFAATEEGDALKLDFITSSLGIAIVTSIVGFYLKIIEAPVEQKVGLERTSQQFGEMNRIADIFIHNMNKMGRDMEGIIGRLDKLSTSVETDIKKASNSAVAGIAEAGQGVSASMQTVVTKLSEDFSKISTKMTNVSDQLNKDVTHSTTKAVESIDNVGKTVAQTLHGIVNVTNIAFGKFQKDLENAPSVLSEVIEARTEGLGKTVETLNSQLLESGKLFVQQSETLARLQQSLEGVQRSLAGVEAGGEKISQSAAAAVEYAESLKKINENVRPLINTYEPLVAANKKLLEDMRPIAEGIPSELRAASELSAQLRSQLEKQAVAMAGTVKQISDSMDTYGKTFDKAVNLLGDVLEFTSQRLSKAVK